jgi:phospholipase C
VGDGIEREGKAGFTRRGVLQAGLVAAAGVGVGGWAAAANAADRPSAARGAAAGGSAAGGAAAGGAAAPTAKRKPGSLPYPNLAPGTDTVPQITNIVVLMMENHSYDNKLGMLRRHGAEGFVLGRDRKPTASNPYFNGDIQHAFHMPTTCQLTGFPSQEWTQSHIQFAGGRNDGFVKSASGPVAMGYWDREDQPFYYSMCDVFPISDRYFCSVLGQTYPNRRYLMSATSLGMVDDTLPGANDYPVNGTIFDKLDAENISWKNYYSTTSSTLLYPKLFEKNAGTKVVLIGEPASKGKKATGFFADAKKGTLPSFSLVEPNYSTTSEEDPQNIVRGEKFAASVIDAVMSGPNWPGTVLIWTYDEHGGYYDHVPPPRALQPDDIQPKVPKGVLKYEGFRRYGFRVPLAVISPWSRKDFVSHAVMDHTSICALTEAKWNLPAMTYRDANANNMLHMLDFSTPHFLKPPKLAKPRVVTDPASLACSVKGPGKIPPKGSVSPPRKKK